MMQTINTLKREDVEKRISVLRLELDYELATLYDAMKEKNKQQKENCIKKLKTLRLEMIDLNT